MKDSTREEIKEMIRQVIREELRLSVKNGGFTDPNGRTITLDLRLPDAFYTDPVQPFTSAEIDIKQRDEYRG